MATKEEVKKDVAKFSALESVKESAGGKILIESLEKDIISAIDEITTKYKTATRDELVSSAAKLAERLNIIRAFNKAGKNKKLAKEELKFLLEEDK